jgi:hypothetical protein
MLRILAAGNVGILAPRGKPLPDGIEEIEGFSKSEGGELNYPIRSQSIYPITQQCFAGASI